MFRRFQEVLWQASSKDKIQRWVDSDNVKYEFYQLFNHGSKLDKKYLTDDDKYYFIDKKNRICIVNKNVKKILFSPS